MQDRDLDITKFSYFSYRKLKKTLGEFDAVVECNEIAIKEFIEQAPKEKIQEYIQELSQKQKVKVNEVDFLKFSSRIRQYYILSVFQQAEQFLKDFKVEWTNYFIETNWAEPISGETKLQNVLRNISLTLPNEIIDIYEYYRLVRNYMSHTDRDLNELENRLRRIQSNKNEFLTNLHFASLPNKLDEISFSDFLLLTNIIKHIAFLISTSAKPNNERIAEILIDKAKENSSKAYQGLKKIKNNKDRFETAIKSFITTNFGRFSNSDIDNITKEFKSLLA